MNPRILLGVLVFGLIALQPLPASPITSSRIEIFINDADRLKNLDTVKQSLAPVVEIQVYDLSAPERFKQTLSAGLPDDPEAAKKRAMERIAKIDTETLKKQLLTAYQGALNAALYGIDRLPAVVFDRGQSVVYGVTDLEVALEYYRRWQGETQY